MICGGLIWQTSVGHGLADETSLVVTEYMAPKVCLMAAIFQAHEIPCNCIWIQFGNKCLLWADLGKLQQVVPVRNRSLCAITMNSTFAGHLNDLWQYNMSTSEWTWLSGDTFAGSNGNYTQRGVPNPYAVPPGRGSKYLGYDLIRNHLYQFGGPRSDSKLQCIAVLYVDDF